MKLFFSKVSLALFSIIFSSINSFSQETAIYNNANADFNKAIELYNNKSYAAAQKTFENVKLNSQKKETLYSDASYYEAMCAIKLNYTDADKKVLDFVKENPASNKKNKAYFNVGNYYFANNKAAHALKWFEKVNIDLISDENKKELNFKMGYSLLVADKLELAKNRFLPLINDPKYGDDSRYYYGFIAYKLEDYGIAESTLKQIADNASYKAEISYYLLDISFKTGKFERCIEVGAKLLANSKRKEASEISKIVGESFFNLKKYAEAIPYLLAYKGKNGKWNNTDYYQLGYAYYKQNDFENALRYFNRIIDEKNAVAQNVYYHLAECYLNTDKKNEALNAFKAASEMTFNLQIKEDAALNYAKLSYEEGNPYEDVAVVLQNYLKAYPKSKAYQEINALVVSSFIYDKNFEGALNYLKKNPSTENKSFFHEVSLYRGIQLFNEKKLEEAIPYFKNSIDSDYADISRKGKYWEAETLYRLENFEDAVFKFNELKRDTKNNAFHLLDYNIGYAYFKLQKYDKAADAFKYFSKRANIEDDVKNDALIRLGDSYFAIREYNSAISSYENLVKNNALQSDYAQYQIGMSYGFMNNDTDKIVSLTKVINNYKVSTLKDDALYQLASTYTKVKDNEKAHQAYDRLVTKYPKSNFISKALVRQGLLYYNDNNNEKALEKFKLVAAKYPNSPEVIQAVRNAKNIYIDEDRLNDYVTWTKSLNFIEVSDSELENTSFAIAEKKYFEANNKATIISLKKYLKDFPKSKNKLKATYYLADVLYKEESFDEALAQYKTVIDAGTSEFLEDCLAKVSLLYLKKEEYANAIPYLKQLEQEAYITENIQFAKSNLMKSYAKTEANELAINYAKQILASKKLTEDLELDAKKIIARTSIVIEDFETAKEYYENLETIAKGELKAETLYYNAWFKSRDKEYEASNKVIQKLIAEYANYKYWGVKSYVVMGKNYYSLKDAYQATFILENIIKNFTQFEDIIKEAEAELNKIKTNEAKTNNSVKPKN
ncbi:MAG: tetratricopeptide repeat protein [Flavobacteriaceae bacterium]|nr:tetratricopeptide repeat protein [Flavobacteriaceae bacterium]